MTLSNGFLKDPLSSAELAEIGNITGISPKARLAGTAWDYTQVGPMDTGEVQYSRVRLASGYNIAKMSYYQASGGAAGRQVRMGVYTQTDAADENGVPNAKAVETAAFGTAGLDGQYVEMAITYLVPADGYYWLAWVTDSSGAETYKSLEIFSSNVNMAIDNFSLSSVKRSDDDSPNLVINSGFEYDQDGFPPYLIRRYTGNLMTIRDYEKDYLAKWSLDTVEKHSGKQSMRITKDEFSTSAVALFGGVGIVEGGATAQQPSRVCLPGIVPQCMPGKL